MNMDNWVSETTRITELETRLARLEKLLTITLDLAQKNPLAAKFVRKIQCELQR